MLSVSFMQYEEAYCRVIKAWYEARIKEEQEKNTLLKQLHTSLLKAKELQEKGDDEAEAAT